MPQDSRLHARSFPDADEGVPGSGQQVERTGDQGRIESRRALVVGSSMSQEVWASQPAAFRGGSRPGPGETFVERVEFHEQIDLNERPRV